MKLFMVCGVFTSRRESRCGKHPPASGIGANHHVHADARRAPPVQADDRPPRRGSAWSRPFLVAGSEKEAAHPLGLSHSTVKHHLANARSKAGERAVQSGSGDDRAARVNPRPAPARARERGPKRTNSDLLDGTEPAGPTQQIVLQTPVVVALGHHVRSHWPTC